MVNDGNDLRDEDDATAATDSWTLRQITFLGLTAPNAKASTEEDDDGNDGETPKNALDARNLSDFLMEIGACSVAITDTDADTDEENPMFHEPSLTSCSDDLLNDEELNEEWAMIIPDLAAGRNLWRRCDVSAHCPLSILA